MPIDQATNHSNGVNGTNGKPVSGEGLASHPISSILRSAAAKMPEQQKAHDITEKLADKVDQVETKAAPYMQYVLPALGIVAVLGGIGVLAYVYKTRGAKGVLATLNTARDTVGATLGTASSTLGTKLDGVKSTLSAVVPPAVQAIRNVTHI